MSNINFQILYFVFFLSVFQANIYANTDSLIITGYEYFPEGYELAVNENKWGVFDRKGNVLIAKAVYEYIEYNDPYFLLKKNNKWGVLDNKGNLIKEIDYDSIIIGFSKPNIHFLKKKGKWILTDSAFVQIIDESFEEIIKGTDYYAVKNNSEWKLLNIGNMKLGNVTFSEILKSPGGIVYEADNHFWVKNNSKWMYSDESGIQNSDEIFDELSFLSFKLHATALQNGLWYLIDLNSGKKLSVGFDSVKIVEPFPVYIGYKGNSKCLLDRLGGCTKCRNFDLYDSQIGYIYDTDILLIKRKNKWAVVHVSELRKPYYKYHSVEVETKDSEKYGTKNFLKCTLPNGNIEYVLIN